MILAEYPIFFPCVVGLCSLYPEGFTFEVGGFEYGSLKVKFEGARKSYPSVYKTAGKVSYFGRGTSYTTSAYRTLLYRDVWPGIDVKVVGTSDGPEMQFIVKVGGNPSDIALSVEGGIAYTDGNAVVIRNDTLTLRLGKLEAYQGADRISVKPAFKTENGKVLIRYNVGKYNPHSPLIIDPIITAILSSSSADDYAYAVKVSPSGYIYVGGQIGDASTYLSGYNHGTPGGADGFVSRFTLSGHDATAILASSLTDEVLDIEFDGAGYVYVSGSTKDANTFGPSRTIHGTPSPGEKDVFAVKLSGDLSTYIGGVILASTGKDEGHAIIVGSDGSIFVTGQAGDGNTFACSSCPQKVWIGDSDGQDEAFVVKMAPDGTLLKVALLTSDDLDEAYDIDIDASGYVYIAGRTKNYDDFACHHEYYGGSPTLKFGYSAFVTRLDYDLNCIRTGILASEIVSDVARTVRVGPDGRVFVGGLTEDPSSFPKSPKYYYGDSDDQDAFIVKLSNNLRSHDVTAMLSSLGKDKIYEIDIDPTTWDVVAVGETEGTNSFAPDPERIIEGTPGGTENFVSRLNYDLNDHMVTYLLVSPGDDYAYALDVDGDGVPHVAGETSDYANFSTSRAIFGTPGGGREAFVSVINPVTTSLTDKPPSLSYRVFLSKEGIVIHLKRASYVGATFYDASGRIRGRETIGYVPPGTYTVKVEKDDRFVRVRVGGSVKVIRLPR